MRDKGLYAFYAHVNSRFGIWPSPQIILKIDQEITSSNWIANYFKSVCNRLKWSGGQGVGNVGENMEICGHLKWIGGKHDLKFAKKHFVATLILPAPGDLLSSNNFHWCRHYIARLITSPRAHFSVTSPRGQPLYLIMGIGNFSTFFPNTESYSWHQGQRI